MAEAAGLWRVGVIGRDLPGAERINLSHVSRIFRVTLFGPDIVERIWDGRRQDSCSS